MDAISFVLGVQSKHLRSNNLKDLVFRKSISSAPARKASVKLIYELSAHELNDCNEGTELIFCRNISSAGVSSYRLNDKDVSYERYEQTLQVIGTTSYHDLYYNFYHHYHRHLFYYHYHKHNHNYVNNVLYSNLRVLIYPSLTFLFIHPFFHIYPSIYYLSIYLYIIQHRSSSKSKEFPCFPRRC